MNEETVRRRARMLLLSAPAEPADADSAPDAGSDEVDPVEAAALRRVGTLLAHPGTWQEAPALPAALLAEIRESATATAVAVAVAELPGDTAVAEPPETATEPEPERPADGAAPPVVAKPRRRPRWSWSWPRPSFGLAVGLTAALLAAVLFGTELWSGSGSTQEPTNRFQLAGTSTAPGARANVEATERAAGWRLVLDIEGLAPAAADAYYQGWAVRDDQYVSLGTFHMRQPGQVELWSGVPLRRFNRIEVTSQRIGAGLAPGPLVMVGRM